MFRSPCALLLLAMESKWDTNGSTGLLVNKWNFTEPGAQGAHWDHRYEMFTPFISFNHTILKLTDGAVGVLTTYLLTPVLRDVLLLSRPLLLSTLIGCSVSLGLAFSSSFRLLALLVAPQIFTNQARIVLLGYALGLAMSGPGTNYVKNLEILTNSIHACMVVNAKKFHICKQ